jgi:hypothetical protein
LAIALKSNALQSGQENDNRRTNNQTALVAINLTGNNLANNIRGNNGDYTISGSAIARSADRPARQATLNVNVSIPPVIPDALPVICFIP